MFRMWVKIWKEAHLLRDTVIEDGTGDNRTKKVFRSLEEACKSFDLSNPIWLEKNVRDFRKQAKTRFTRDNFIEEISFDYLEIQMLEEDG